MSNPEFRSAGEEFIAQHQEKPKQVTPEELEQLYQENLEWITKTMGAVAANEYAESSLLRQKDFGPSQSPEAVVQMQASVDRHQAPIAYDVPNKDPSDPGEVPTRGSFNGTLEVPTYNYSDHFPLKKGERIVSTTEPTSVERPRWTHPYPPIYKAPSTYPSSGRRPAPGGRPTQGKRATSRWFRPRARKVRTK